MTTAPLTIQALLDTLTAWQTTADAEITDLSERLAKLTDALTAAERQRGRWAETRETVLTILAEEHPEQAAAPQPATPAYQQIIAVFATATGTTAGEGRMPGHQLRHRSSPHQRHALETKKAHHP